MPGMLGACLQAVGQEIGHGLERRGASGAAHEQVGGSPPCRAAGQVPCDRKVPVSPHGDKGCGLAPMDGQTPPTGRRPAQREFTFPAQGRDALHRQDEAEQCWTHMVTNDGPHLMPSWRSKATEPDRRAPAATRILGHQGRGASGDGVVLIAEITTVSPGFK